VRKPELVEAMTRLINAKKIHIGKTAGPPSKAKKCLLPGPAPVAVSYTPDDISQLPTYTPVTIQEGEHQVNLHAQAHTCPVPRQCGFQTCGGRR
jgi:hypothetical protein